MSPDAQSQPLTLKLLIWALIAAMLLLTLAVWVLPQLWPDFNLLRRGGEAMRSLGLVLGGVAVSALLAGFWLWRLAQTREGQQRLSFQVAALALVDLPIPLGFILFMLTGVSALYFVFALPCLGLLLLWMPKRQPRSV